MFTGAEMTRSNVSQADQPRLVKALMTFTDVLRQACFSVGLGPGEVPFIRPVNFVSVINPAEIHVVVDDVSVGGMPDHVYLDRRKELPVLPLDAIVGVAVREFGFRNPMAISLPLLAISEDEDERQRVLKSIVPALITQLQERALVRSLALPKGYEHFARFMPAFLRDHPNVERNVFLMMRFRSGPQYDEIHHVLHDGMARYGLQVLTADDKDYTGDLWENVCLYMLGSQYGAAVFEEIDLREFNPNVALELGFMIAHAKRCLFLKDQRMPRMPTDIVGKLYKEFDTYNIAKTIDAAIAHWARDLGLAGSFGGQISF